MPTADIETGTAATGSEPAIVLEHVSKRYVVGKRSLLTRSPGPSDGEPLDDDDAEELEEDEEERGADEPVERELWALRDVSLEVASGSSVGFIGRDGSGKTTLLKILAMITPPSEGRAIVRGRVAPLLRSAQGFLVEELDARGNALLLASLFGFPRALVEERVRTILSFAELEHLAGTRASRYSPGLKRRLAMATILHLRPDVLLVDESLATGDADFRSRCFGLIDELRRDGMTLVLASKNLDLVAELCTEVVWIEGGRIQDRGPAADVLARFRKNRPQEKGSSGKRAREEQDEAPPPAPAQPAWALAHGAWVRVRNLSNPADLVTAINLVLEIQRGDVELRCHLAIQGGSGEQRFQQKRPVVLSEPGMYVARATLPEAVLRPGSYRGQASAQLRADAGQAAIEVQSPFSLQIAGHSPSPASEPGPEGQGRRWPGRAAWQIERLDGANRVWHA